jgi:hypothetical protein
MRNHRSAGIGKTTLAQMLVADAIKQGFEPIEVSRNIDEAWRVFDPESPQIFYYDDFLGTITLGELEKNEDQSLVSFIAAIAQRSNALFVLTTREYIYKQAHALYESFERAGVDARKFLLTVDDYGLIDRAQILYNHVFHAENLPEAARHSLVDESGYRQIVEHELFNPRLIEAITAEYGFRQVEEGVDFVEYAVSALEDPELIWRRVYENQIEDRERTLLHALVTMPLPAQLGDLCKAFLSLAEERGLGVGETDFEAALEVLDDSLITTHWTEGEHIAQFANPSIHDFVRKRLAGSPSSIRLAIQAVCFSDQMWSINKMLDLVEIPDDLAAPMAARRLDLFESDSIIWTRSVPSPGTLRLIRTHRHLEGRLVSILELIDHRQGSEFDRLRAAAAERLEGLRENWRRGVGSEHNALRLLQALSADDAALGPPDGILEDIKHLLVARAWAPYDYRRLIDFRYDFPDVFSEEEMDEVAEQFRSQAEEVLAHEAEKIPSGEDLQAYGIVAEELGVTLDEQRFQEAAKTIARVVEQEERRFERYEEDWEEPYDGDVAEQEEMDTLFRRLLD